MRLLRLSASLALLSVTTARLIMVNFPPGTTDELYQATKSAFREAGGEISHEFNIIRCVICVSGILWMGLRRLVSLLER